MAKNEQSFAREYVYNNKLYGINVAAEYKKIQQKKCMLSKSIRDLIVITYEKHMAEMKAKADARLAKKVAEAAIKKQAEAEYEPSMEIEAREALKAEAANE